MARKRKIDSRMLIYTIFASLIVITPIILIAYLCISNQFEMCPKYMNGEFISVRCREVTSTLEIINKYKGALLATLIGNAFLMPAILLGYYEHHQEKDSIRNDIIVIALYFISWIIAIYLTWYPLF
ncbi:MAG: hypothetical protein IKP79_01750, partial [Bacilli bacterium]|nr:hypothetical protein [Bacilli bacterium]